MLCCSRQSVSVFWLPADAHASVQLCWSTAGNRYMSNLCLKIRSGHLSTRQAEHEWHQQRSVLDVVNESELPQITKENCTNNIATEGG
jgi:hypothetical protein